jgi:hypothetical protein
MSWILPVTLVLVVGLVIGAIHFLFVRWMARQTEPATVREPAAAESTPDRRP